MNGSPWRFSLNVRCGALCRTCFSPTTAHTDAAAGTSWSNARVGASERLQDREGATDNVGVGPPLIPSEAAGVGGGHDRGCASEPPTCATSAGYLQKARPSRCAVPPGKAATPAPTSPTSVTKGEGCSRRRAKGANDRPAPSGAIDCVVRAVALGCSGSSLDRAALVAALVLASAAVRACGRIARVATLAAVTTARVAALLLVSPGGGGKVVTGRCDPWACNAERLD